MICFEEIKKRIKGKLKWVTDILFSPTTAKDRSKREEIVIIKVKENLDFPRK